MYDSTYGLWKVETEGDCEGRTKKDIGIYKGYVDEIALHLADKCLYSLMFTKLNIKHKEKYVPVSDKVNICFNIDSNTWNMNSIDRVNEMKTFFADRPCEIEKSNYYGSFVIRNDKKVNKEDIEKMKALKKLSKRERDLLGLNDMI